MKGMDTTNLVEQTLGITSDQLVDFLAETGIGPECSCGKGYQTVSHDAEGAPSILATGNPRNVDSADWFFWTACNKCAAIKMYSAGVVWAHLYGSKDESHE